MSGRLVIGGREWPLEPGLRAADLPGEEWAQAIGRAVETWFSEAATVELRTSGSTGEPRVVVHGKEAMRASAERTAEALGLGGGTGGWLVMPVGFVGGFMMLVRAIEGGHVFGRFGPRFRSAPSSTVVARGSLHWLCFLIFCRL